MASSKVLCGPCGNDKISKDAHKWCTHCHEGFCKDCEKMHKATKMSRDHKLIGIEDYQKISSISIKQTCEEHENTFDFYCKTHDKALCFSCVLSQHTSCGGVIPLVDAAKHAKTSTVFTDLEETISIGIKNVQIILQNTSSEHLDQQETKIKEEIKRIRSQINSRLDEMENSFITELKSKIATCRSKHERVYNNMKEFEKTMKMLQMQTTEIKQLASDLHIFLGTRQIEREAHKCLESTSTYNTIDKCNVKFELNQVLTSLLVELKTFGNINTEGTMIQIPLLQPKVNQAQIPVLPLTKNISEIGVKLRQTFRIKKESKEKGLTGCAILPNGQLLIACHFGKKQLMQYNQNGKHVRDIPLSGQPYDITVIDSDYVAISYGVSGYIEILNIQNITKEKKVELGNNTFGLSYQEGKLYVNVFCRGIFVIDMSGKIVNTININVINVNYITTTTDRIYFSDRIKDTVICRNMSGKLIWKFRDDSVKYLCGLTVDNNQNVFLVARDSHNITIISRDGQTSKTLLTKSDGLNFPQAIDFNKDTGDLLVCNRDDTKAFLFQLSLK